MTKPLTIVEKLKDSYSFLGDPLHREAWEEIERLQKEVMAWWKETEIMRSDLAAYSHEIERLRSALNKIVQLEGWPNIKGKDYPSAKIAADALGDNVVRWKND